MHGYCLHGVLYYIACFQHVDHFQVEPRYLITIFWLILVFSSSLWMMHRPFVQAKEALQSPYFDDLDKETVDALESDIIRAREG